MGKEIERKWRLKTVPTFVLIEGAAKHITQGYLYIADNGEVRLRHEGDEYHLTGKGKGNLSRPEEDYTLVTEMIFNFLWPRIIGAPINKVRYTYRCGDRVYQFDVHEDNLKSYVCVEVEFKTIEDAQVFTLPCWVGEAVDVTDDKRYKGKNLALNPHIVREDPRF